MRGYTYVYIQAAVFRNKKRRVESFSLGKIADLGKIITRLLSTSETLFIGEIILNELFERLDLVKGLEREMRAEGATPLDIEYFQFLVSMRIMRPFSKDALARYYDHSYFKLWAPTPKVEEFYRAMDAVKEPEKWFRKISQQTLKKLNYQYKAVYYDTTTVYFYSTIDELRRKGHGKDGPRWAPLIKLALSCTEDYLPLTYAVRPGNAADITCFKEFLKEDWHAIGGKDVLLVFDSGCYSFDLVLEIEGRQKKLKEKWKTDYIANCDICNYTLNVQSQMVVINGQKWEIKEGKYKKRKIITGYNVEHHHKAKEKIDLQIERVREFAHEVTGRSVESKEKKIIKLIKSLGLKKVLTVEFKGQSFHINDDEEALAKKKEKAKLVILMTSLSIPADQVLTRYLRRGEVERAYHYLKTPLKARPVYHSKHDRIHAHFFLVLLGYLQLTILRYYLKQTYQITLTLDQLLEDLRFATSIALEPKKDIFMTYSGRQVPWLRQLIDDWNMPFKRIEPDFPLDKRRASS
jgi:transposase